MKTRRSNLSTGLKAIPIAAFLAAMSAVGIASASFSWSPWFSEESSPSFRTCSTDRQAIDGFRCSGSYCDNVGIRCNELPFGMRIVDQGWEAQISDRSGGPIVAGVIGGRPDGFVFSNETGHVCGLGDGVLTGVHCANSYCDDLFLICGTPVVDYEGEEVLADFVNCDWSLYYSEEDPWFAPDPSANEWITGVRCRDSYCDDKSYRVCELADPRSCEMSCGDQASAGCWCDSLCSQYGDCCDDYVSACTPRD